MSQKHGARYPWDQWFARSRFTLKRGVHYQCRSDTMAQQVRTAGRRPRYGVKVSVEIAEDGQSLAVTVTQRRRLGV